MKRFFSLILAVLMMTGICAFAAAEPVDTLSFRISSPSGAPGLALAVLAAENPDQWWKSPAGNVRRTWRQ